MSIFYKERYNRETKQYEYNVERYKGCVLFLREHNGFEDSDFYALVYNKDTDKFEEIEYGSTRYAGGGVAHVDATPEILALYRTRAEQAAFRCKVQATWKFHQYRVDFCKATNVSFKEANKLFNAYGAISADLVRVGKLLHTRNFRSDFRKKMAEQVRTWLKDENPKYKTPLSPKQMDFCTDSYRGDDVRDAPWNDGTYAHHLDYRARFGTGYIQL